MNVIDKSRIILNCIQYIFLDTKSMSRDRSILSSRLELETPSIRGSRPFFKQSMIELHS